MAQFFLPPRQRRRSLFPPSRTLQNADHTTHTHTTHTGTATLLAHYLRNDAEASALMTGVKVRAVGVATPAVLTAKMAEECSEYVTSVVLMVRVYCLSRVCVHVCATSLALRGLRGP